MFALGAALIILYVISTVGPQLRYISMGLLTACVAFLIGISIRIVFGIPHIVSSCVYRHHASILETNRLQKLERDALGTADAEPMPFEPTRHRSHERSEAPGFLPSTKLAEISDRLTKLLLGVGLVGLTRLGRPLSELIHNVARNLGSTTVSGRVKESAVVMAGAILITYVALGFLSGHLTTGPWYGKRVAAKWM